MNRLVIDVLDCIFLLMRIGDCTVVPHEVLFLLKHLLIDIIVAELILKLVVLLLLPPQLVLVLVRVVVLLLVAVIVAEFFRLDHVDIARHLDHFLILFIVRVHLFIDELVVPLIGVMLCIGT